MIKNILHISTGKNGGAGKSAFLLHNALINLGINSNILTLADLDPNDASAHSLTGSPLKKLTRLILKRAEYQFTQFYKPIAGSAYSAGIFGTRIISHPAYKAADIIHLHWISQGMLNISGIEKIDKPIVWTLHDMWPFTGGCHYPLNCSRYMALCHDCPLMQRTFGFDVATFLHKRKMTAFKRNKVHWVAVSSWMKNMAEKSSICNQMKIGVINNGIDLTEFYPVERQAARKAFDLPLNQKIILIGAQDLNAVFKGFSTFLDCLQYVQGNCHIVLFGNSNPDEAKLKKLSYTHLGFIQKKSELRQIYSAVDVFVLPSIQETFGQVTVESMACGTPVVAFNTNGTTDIVDHKTNGYLATPFIAKDLANGINWLLNTDLYSFISKNAIEKVHNNFSISRIAEKYFLFYNQMELKKNTPGRY